MSINPIDTTSGVS